MESEVCIVGAGAAGGILALERRRYMESRSRVALAPERFLDLLALKAKRKPAEPDSGPVVPDDEP